jgi:hypothetical protein
MRISLPRSGSLAVPGCRKEKAPPVLETQRNAIGEIN